MNLNTLLSSPIDSDGGFLMPLIFASGLFSALTIYAVNIYLSSVININKTLKTLSTIICATLVICSLPSIFAILFIFAILSLPLTSIGLAFLILIIFLISKEVNSNGKPLPISSMSTILGICAFPSVVLTFMLLPTLSLLISYIGLAVLTYLIIKWTKPKYLARNPLTITLLIAIIVPIISYGIHPNAYSEEGYIKKAHEVLGIDPSVSHRSNVYHYYDHIKTCPFNWQNKKSDISFMLLRLFGRQKYLVIIDDHRIVLNRHGEQFKSLGKSQPYTHCGG